MGMGGGRLCVDSIYRGFCVCRTCYSPHLAAPRLLGAAAEQVVVTSFVSSFFFSLN